MEADLRWCAPVIPLHTALIIAAFARRECQTPRAKIKNKHSRTLLTNQADPYAQAVAYYGLSAFLVRRRYLSYHARRMRFDLMNVSESVVLISFTPLLAGAVG